jgi:hypothetical protein
LIEPRSLNVLPYSGQPQALKNCPATDASGIPVGEQWVKTLGLEHTNTHPHVCFLLKQRCCGSHNFTSFPRSWVVCLLLPEVCIPSQDLEWGRVQEYHGETAHGCSLDVKVNFLVETDFHDVEKASRRGECCPLSTHAKGALCLELFL